MRPDGRVSDVQLNYEIRHDSGHGEQPKEHEQTQKCCKSSDFVCAPRDEGGAGCPGRAGGAAGGREDQAGCRAAHHLPFQFASTKNPSRGSCRGYKPLWLRDGKAGPDFLRIHSKVRREP